MDHTFYLRIGDTLRPIREQLSDEEGAIDLTGCSVAFVMTDSEGIVKVNSGGTVVDAGTGQVRYDFQSEDVDTEGKYERRWVCSDGGGGQFTVPSNGEYFVVIDD